ncbi:STAS domain-containing protein [Blastococcus sp. TF02A-35]|uniref:STAS domain-containing protein n=1 Tax=Blastococcus sp. TF02A-35 TaxID=2559612 RepID=UPI001073C5A6|nr:STAS domain-containing protein [Blastococcus sp. TF02A_35]TFV47775.1 anti-sigma factor antagonist [Blastococcus sp. TF02A_35]
MTASSLDRPSTIDGSSTSDVLDLGLVTLVRSGPAAMPSLAATGEIDCTTAPQVRARIEQLLDDGARDLTLDLTAVTFLDSAGLCALATVHRRTTADQVRFRVLAASRAVIRPMQITGLWDLLGGQRVESLAS